MSSQEELRSLWRDALREWEPATAVPDLKGPPARSLPRDVLVGLECRHDALALNLSQPLAATGGTAVSADTLFVDQVFHASYVQYLMARADAGPVFTFRLEPLVGLVALEMRAGLVEGLSPQGTGTTVEPSNGGDPGLLLAALLAAQLEAAWQPVRSVKATDLAAIDPAALHLAEVDEVVVTVCTQMNRPRWRFTLCYPVSMLEQVHGELSSIGRRKMSETATVGPEAKVSLREITAETVGTVCKLSDTLIEPQSHFVAPNVYSIAQAYFSKQAWFRAIYADEAPVGFVMIRDDPEKQAYFLWRFMIARPYQGNGFGRRALELLVEHVKTRPGAIELLVSCGQGEGSPEGFYLKLGFEHNGEKYGHEIGLRLGL